MEERNATFDGSIPENYDRYLGPVLFEPYAIDLATRLNTEAIAAVLELACGSGILTRHLRRRLPVSARLVASDLNEPMLHHAKARSIGYTGIEWKQANASAVPFPDGSFDVIVCQFGLMFVPDKAAVLGEIHRLLRPNGILLFNVWESLAVNDLQRLAHQTLARLFPGNPPTFYEVPSSMHDQAAINEMLLKNSFYEIAISIVPKIAEIPFSKEVARGLVYGNPLIGAIRDQSIIDAETVVNEIDCAITVECGSAPARAKMQAIVVSATRPPDA